MEGAGRESLRQRVGGVASVAGGVSVCPRRGGREGVALVVVVVILNWHQFAVECVAQVG